MTDQRLSAREVCTILRACSKLKIKRFKYIDLEVVLDDAPPEGSGQETSLKDVEAVALIQDRGLRQQRVTSREDELALLAIEDPAAFERHLLSEDADDGPEDDPPDQ